MHGGGNAIRRRIAKGKDDFEKTWEKKDLQYELRGMAVRVIANLGFVAHTERYLSANCSFLEYKEVVQRPKLANWKVPPPGQSGRDVYYFHDFVLGERRYHHRPGRPPDLRRPNLRHPGQLRFYLEADSLAFNVFLSSRKDSLVISMASWT